MNWYKLLVAGRGRPRKHTNMISKIVRLYEKKKSLIEVSKTTGIGISTIRNILKREGVLRSWEDATGYKSVPLTPEMEREVCDKNIDGYSPTEISKMLNIPYSKVYRILQRNGFGSDEILGTPKQQRDAYLARQEKTNPQYNSISERPGNVYLPNIESMEGENYIVKLYKPVGLGGYGKSITDISALYHTTDRTIKNILIKHKAYFSKQDNNAFDNPYYYSKPNPWDKRSPGDSLLAPTDPFVANPIFAKRIIFHLLKSSE